jgi:hypothetical protein
MLPIILSLNQVYESHLLLRIHTIISVDAVYGGDSTRVQQAMAGGDEFYSAKGSVALRSTCQIGETFETRNV